MNVLSLLWSHHNPAPQKAVWVKYEPKLCGCAPIVKYERAVAPPALYFTRDVVWWLVECIVQVLTFAIIIYFVIVDTCMSQHAANHTSYISQLRRASQYVGWCWGQVWTQTSFVGVRRPSSISVRLRPQRWTRRALVCEYWWKAMFKFSLQLFVCIKIVAAACMYQHAFTPYVSH